MPNQIAVTKGGNRLLFKAGEQARSLLVGLDWRESQPTEIDTSLFILNKNKIVRSDEDFIFYNQPTNDVGNVRHLTAISPELASKGRAGFWIDIDELPLSANCLAICVTCYHNQHEQSLASLKSGVMEIRDATDGTQLASYDFVKDIRDESALIVGEFYRHASGWKFRAIGQGYVGGLPALATNFGVRLEGEGNQVGQQKESGNESIEAPKTETVSVNLEARRKRRSSREVLAEQTQILKRSMEGLLPQILEDCAQQANEAKARMVFDRILQDVFGYSLDQIKAEQNIQGRRADYVLSINGHDVMVVEIKRAGMKLYDRQLFQATSYGAYAGIRWALLTNLLEWKLYRISMEDKVRAKQVFEVNLRDGLDSVSAYYLTLISSYGFSRNGLLEKLWVKLSAQGFQGSENLAFPFNGLKILAREFP